jgi:predicted small secreted protein
MNSIIYNLKQIAVIQQGGRFLLALSLSIIFLTNCSNKKMELVGSWIQSIPGQSVQVQGIRLEAEGKASSINMQTLLYETWEQQGEKIILKGKSIGNGQTISFSDTLKIAKLTADTLVLIKGSFERVYTRGDQNKQ